MIRAIEGPLIVEPETWTLAFDREASSWWAAALALGHYKHVRAFAYVPFLHVWLFYDVHLGGTNLIVAADGEPAQRMIASWIVTSDLLRMRRRELTAALPVAGWCAPAIARLLGLQCVALRPDALYRYCLQNGGVPFEAGNGAITAIPAAGDGSRACSAHGAEQEGGTGCADGAGAR